MVESKPIDDVFASCVIPPLAAKPTWPLIPSAIQCLCLCVHKVFELCVHSVCNPEAIFIFMFLYSERRPALPCRLAKRGSVRGISNSISKANIFYQEQALFVFLFVFVLLCFSLMFFYVLYCCCCYYSFIKGFLNFEAFSLQFCFASMFL